MRTPAFGIAVITPLSSRAPSAHRHRPAAGADSRRRCDPAGRRRALAPVDLSGPSVVAVAKTPAALHVAAAARSPAPPPAVVVVRLAHFAFRRWR